MILTSAGLGGFSIMVATACRLYHHRVIKTPILFIDQRDPLSHMALIQTYSQSRFSYYHDRLGCANCEGRFPLLNWQSSNRDRFESQTDMDCSRLLKLSSLSFLSLSDPKASWVLWLWIDTISRMLLAWAGRNLIAEFFICTPEFCAKVWCLLWKVFQSRKMCLLACSFYRNSCPIENAFVV